MIKYYAIMIYEGKLTDENALIKDVIGVVANDSLAAHGEACKVYRKSHNVHPSHYVQTKTLHIAQTKEDLDQFLDMLKAEIEKEQTT